jgi:enamine deaminase RidA (YjgF/YER057c/UK114 family)
VLGKLLVLAQSRTAVPRLEEEVADLHGQEFGANSVETRRPSDAGMPGVHDHEPMTPGIELVTPPALAGGVPYAYAAVTDPGRMVFTAGACPLDADGAVVAVGDVAGQARQVMANLSTVLQAAGAGLSDVLTTTVYVATSDRADLVAAWDVVRTAFADHAAPSTLVGVTVLGYPDQLVEVQAVAVRDSWQEPGPPDDEDTVPG